MIPVSGMRKDVPLAPLTTYRIGGPARFFLDVEDEIQLAEALEWARREGVTFFLLGGGSNVLVDDAGFPGLVVRLKGSFTSIRTDRAAGLIVAGAGAPLPRLGRTGTKLGFLSYLFLTGIPGTVGGGVRINAGTAEGEIKDILDWADVFVPGKGVERRPAGEFHFGYRTSSLVAEPETVVLRAAFRLAGPTSDPVKTAEAVTAHLAARRARQPQNPRTCGSVFKNPEGRSAGLLIDQAGLKGLTIGGAEISRKHANWIVNKGDATAEDVRALIADAQEAVFEMHGVRLEREVIYLPENLSRE